MRAITQAIVFVASFVSANALAQGAETPPGDPAATPAAVEEAPLAPTPAPPPAPPAPPAPPVDPAPVAPHVEPPKPPAVTPTVEADTPPPAPPPALVGYDNGFFLQTPDGNNRLRIRGIVQPRFALVATNVDTTTWTASIFLQRAQLELNGHVFSKNVMFLLRTEFGRGEAFIKDGFIDARVAEGVLVRSGVWKRPFSRQQLAVDWRMAFFDRSITDAAFAAGRDLGVAVQFDETRGPVPLEWAVGVFAGASDRPKVTGDVVIDPEGGLGRLENVKISNIPKLFTPTLGARIGYNFGPLLGYSEMDMEGGPPRFGIAASVLETLDVSGAPGNNTRVQADAMLKWAGATVTGAVFLSTVQTEASSFAQSFDKVGGYVQAGMMLADAWHPALRYGALSQPSTNLVEHEVLANLTWLLFSQNVCVGVEAGSNVGAAGPDARVRVQGQVVF